jgi:L-alanine-DL-glutamate epimerase-like enolase superfamily enzyme
MALHDALGKAAGKPVYELLGVKRARAGAGAVAVGTGSADGDVEEARAKLAAGYAAYKIKVGTGTPRDDAERTRRICAALGSGHLICADANQGYYRRAGSHLCRNGRSHRLDFFEQPVAGDDLAGMAKVAAASRVPIGCDEGLHGVADLARHHEARAASGASLKRSSWAACAALYQAAEMCESLGMKVNLACKIAESGYRHRGGAAPGGGGPGGRLGRQLSSQYLADDVVRTPLAIDRGHADVPAGPGSASKSTRRA